MTDFYYEVVFPFTLNLSVVIALLFSIMVLIYRTDPHQCGKYSEVTGRETKFASGVCYVKDDGQWWDSAEFDARITAGKLK